MPVWLPAPLPAEAASPRRAVVTGADSGIGRAALAGGGLPDADPREQDRPGIHLGRPGHAAEHGTAHRGHDWRSP